MPRLPLSPDLDHLKQQAKRLLKAHRVGDPDALERVRAQQVRGVQGDPFRLADAQWVVAKEYGFPSWVRLKTFVEAAAVPAQTSNKALSNRQRFVRDFALELMAAAGRGDAEALGSRFAAMPLRDILAVRQALSETNELGAVVTGLVEGLDHTKPRVRFNCAGALDHLADERSTGPLRRLLDDPVPRVRRAAMHSLSCDACKLSPLPHGDDLVPKLIDMALSDPSIRVRRAAVPALESYCNDVRVQRALRDLARVERDATTTRIAQQALRRLGLQGL